MIRILCANTSSLAHPPRQCSSQPLSPVQWNLSRQVLLSLHLSVSLKMRSNMQRQWQWTGFVSAIILSHMLLCQSVGFAEEEKDEQQTAEVEALVRQLNDDSGKLRDEAENKLLEMAPLDNVDRTDAFLQILPRPQEGMPEEVKTRLSRLRQEIETRQAEAAVSASSVTLSADSLDLDEVLDAIEKQTGNRLEDFRDQFGQDSLAKTVTLELENEEFWPALDQILDQTELSPYSFSGEDSLAIVNRDQGDLSRYGRGDYSGPFRVEIVNIVAQRNLRNPSQESARLEMEVAWEPRLRPIALSQPVENIKIVGDDSQSIGVASPQAVLDVEVQPGSHSTELIIPIALPPRSVKKIDRLQGEISALVPGRVAEFKFADLDKGESIEQEKGGVKVIVDRVHKNHGLWEVHMRLQILSDEAGLESHRGWVFQNMTYILDKNGEKIDDAGMETTIQGEKEIGLAYFYELPDDDLASYTWVYRTPAAVVRVPVKYELRDLPLP